MNPELLQKLETVRTAARLHQHWLALFALTTVAVGTGSLLGAAGARRTDQLLARRDTLTETARMMGAWTAAFQPPTPAESLAWQHTRAAIDQLAGLSSDRLAAARVAAERAQAAGLRDARLSFLAPDSQETDPPPLGDDPRLSPGPILLTVESSADLRSLSRFLSTLPPGLAVWQVHVVRAGRDVQARVVVASYQP